MWINSEHEPFWKVICPLCGKIVGYIKKVETNRIICPGCFAERMNDKYDLWGDVTI